jgi:hypothetical protein
MPSRKTIRPPPNFSFVPLELEGKETSWLKVHSGAARSHAAYWGGSARHQRQEKCQAAEQQDNAVAPASDTDRNASPANDTKPIFRYFVAPTVRRRNLSKSKTTKDTIRSMQAGSAPLYHIEPNNLQYLPSVPPEIKVTGLRFASGLTTFEFCGTAFVKRFVMIDHEDYSIMFSGFLLLSYAYSMALTGHGTKLALLELKEQVIGRIRAKIKSSDGLLSPQCLTAILALGAPIVCLVSRDLPQSLSVWDYIMATMRDDYLCCPASADKAESALDERIVHRQALCRLFIKSYSNFRDAESLALLQYVANCINM